jgi:SAM-dependent MidA family methyltransferase
MSQLEGIIRAGILETGPIRFDRFMEQALYHPGLGYYAKTGGPSPIGRSGDFFTSVSVGPLFGRLLARQFYQMWNVLEKPRPFALIEQGAHDGQLARDILDWCRAETPDFFEAIQYVIVHGSGSVPPDTAEFAGRITCVEDLESLTARSVAIFFSNELVDAFPVRRVVRSSGAWLEQQVGIDDEKLIWTNQPIDDVELIQAIDELNLPALEGYTTEVNLRARHWIGRVARTMNRGYILTIDYGYPASIYYAPFRAAGTLTARVKHRRVDDVLAEPGGCDITAHVDFTALARSGEAAGLATLGFVDQQRFLTGIAHDELSGAEGPRVKIQENLGAWQTLTHPEHFGARFQVLLQAKNAPGSLDGLRFARPGGL